MRALLLLALLATPTAAAGVPFNMTLEDERGDVRTLDKRPINFTSGDILSFSSVDNGTRVVQRVTMAGRPTAPGDSILVRNWFHNSTNGSFWVVDMEVRGDASRTEERFRPLVRRGDFHNVSDIDATWGVENTTWVFEFDAAAVADATCFDPGVFAEHTQRRVAQGFDGLYIVGKRECTTAEEPEAPMPPPISIGVPRATPAATPPPGSQTPTPAPGAWGLLIAMGLALTLRRSARRS